MCIVRAINLCLSNVCVFVAVRCQERQRQQLEDERSATVAHLEAEKQDATTRLNAEIERLRTEIVGVQRDRDQQLIAAENEHQQVTIRRVFRDQPDSCCG